VANLSVSLAKRVLIKSWDEHDNPLPPKLRYCEAYLGPDGKPRKDVVRVGDEVERHPEGTYYLSFYQGAKRIREAVGRDVDLAWRAKLQKEAELRAAAHGVKLADPTPQGQTVKEAVADYLSEIAMNKKPTSVAAYTKSLAYFQESCSKRYVSEVDRQDMLKFSSWCRDVKKLSPRSCSNRFSNVISFLKQAGRKEIVKASDWPVYVEEQPEIYDQKDLDALFAACDESEGLLFETFLKSGLRDQEMMHLTWNDVNDHNGTIVVRWKPDWGWTPKAYKEREIPIPRSLMEKLGEVRKDGKSLVFGTQSGKPNSHMLRTLKRVVTRAGLDPERYWLHRFRSTFCTRALRAGFDLATVQSWMGHSDLASTSRYLRAARGSEVQAKVNALWES
jgi:integrase/recombinase XerD